MRKKPVGIHNSQQTGVTLIELVIVLSIVAILAVLAVPSWTRYIEKQNMRGVATTLLGDLHRLRSEAIERNKTVTIHFSTGTDWCYGLSDEATQNCNCTTAPQTCTIGGVAQLTSGSRSKQIRLVSTTFTNGTTGFEPTRGMVLQAGAVQFQSSLGYQVTVTLNPVGRITLCSSDATLFPPC